MSRRKLLLACVALVATLALPTAVSAAGPLLGPAPPTILNFVEVAGSEPVIVDANRNGVTDAGDYQQIVESIIYVGGSLDPSEVGQAILVAKLTFVSDSLFQVRARITTQAGSIDIQGNFDPQGSGFVASARGVTRDFTRMRGDMVVTFLGGGAAFQITLR